MQYHSNIDTIYTKAKAKKMMKVDENDDEQVNK